MGGFCINTNNKLEFTMLGSPITEIYILDESDIYNDTYYPLYLSSHTHYKFHSSKSKICSCRKTSSGYYNIMGNDNDNNNKNSNKSNKNDVNQIMNEIMKNNNDKTIESKSCFRS